MLCKDSSFQQKKNLKVISYQKGLELSTKHRWEDSIKMVLQLVGWWGVIQLAQDRDSWWELVNAVMNLWIR